MKKCITILTILVVFICTLTLPNLSDAETATPINISTSADLAKIGVDPAYPLSGSYVLTNDITLDNTYVPIAPDETTPFTGNFNGQGNSLTLNWNDESLYIFKFIKNAKISDLDIEVNGQNLRTTLAYYAGYSDFTNISIEGTITKPSYQIGGLVWACYSCNFTDVKSDVDLSLTAIKFDKYNIIGGIACQVTSEAGTRPWSEGVYANIFKDCSYDGTITANLDTASYEPIGPTGFWTGGLYGATAYDSPASYFGTKIENCNSEPDYNITGTLDTTKVTQYNYINKAGTVFVTYIDGNKSASSKTEKEIVKIGRTHQNIHLTCIDDDITKNSFGYYGTTKAETDAGEHLWSNISAPSLIGIATKDGLSNGRIAGLDNDRLYEYKLQSAATYTSVPAGSEKIQGLSAGTYDVRIISSNGVGLPTKVIINSSTAETLDFDIPGFKDIINDIPANTFTPEQQARINSGEAVSILVEVTPVPENSVEYQNDIDIIQNDLQSNEQIKEYFEIDMLAIIGGDNAHPVTLTNLTKPVQFTVSIPTTLESSANSNNVQCSIDIFGIIKSYNNEAIRVSSNIDYSTNTITFEVQNSGLYGIIFTTPEIAFLLSLLLLIILAFILLIIYIWVVA